MLHFQSSQNTQIKSLKCNEQPQLLECLVENCVIKSNSKESLVIHLPEHGIFKCNICDETFKMKKHLHEHMVNYHEKRDFDCHDCSFQASTSTELMKHLRLTGHQPGKAIQDIRSKFIVCYTCKEEYVSY